MTIDQARSIAHGFEYDPDVLRDAASTLLSNIRVSDDDYYMALDLIARAEKFEAAKRGFR